MTPLVSIAAPAYNEEEGIAQVVEEWEGVLAGLGIEGEIVITDDGSRDATGQVLAHLQRAYPNLQVVTHERNSGYGRALASAIAATQGELVLTIDSDGQFDVGDYPRLKAKLDEGYDLVTGYRLRKRDTPLRVVADRALNLLVRLLFGLPLRDTNCALKLMRGDLARCLTIEARGFPTPTEIVVKAATLGYRVAEVGVTHRQRLAGTSKLNVLSTGWQMLLFLVYLKIKQILYRARIITSM